ncbi:hypothetical protein H3V53_41870 [Paraburkholderia bengalensis]|uniref:Transposase n=1 Tax=Paraburkholderia bengalensis TaxID=2747562 RepID=A0ABU8J5Y0_9BURK
MTDRHQIASHLSLHSHFMGMTTPVDMPASTTDEATMRRRISMKQGHFAAILMCHLRRRPPEGLLIDRTDQVSRGYFYLAVLISEQRCTRSTGSGDPGIRWS